jgi:hypothetical protein
MLPEGLWTPPCRMQFRSPVAPSPRWLPCPQPIQWHHPHGKRDRAQRAVPVFDQRRLVRPDPAGYRLLISNRQCARDQTRLWPDRNHRSVACVHPVTWCPAHLDARVMAGSSARPDPHGHRQRGVARIQICHFERVVGLGSPPNVNFPLSSAASERQRSGRGHGVLSSKRSLYGRTRVIASCHRPGSRPALDETRWQMEVASPLPLRA